jgi:hypothetical protein
VEIYLLNGSELLATYWCDAPFNHKWDNNTSQPDGSDAHFGGVPGWYSTPSFTRRAFSTEIPSLRLRVRKTGSDGWTFQVSAALWLESGQVIEFVQFGREKHFEDADESELYP